MNAKQARAADAKHSRRQSTKRVRGGVPGGSSSGDGGSGVGGELGGVADGKFIGVRGSPSIVEIKNYLGELNFYKTVKEPNVVAAIIHDVARVHADPSCAEEGLNILKVELCIKKEAQTVHKPIGKQFVVDFTKRNPLQLEGLTKSQFTVLKEQIVKQGRQCFMELKEEITGDREDHVQGRRRMDLDTIQPYLAEGDRAQALKIPDVQGFVTSTGHSLSFQEEPAIPIPQLRPDNQSGMGINNSNQLNLLQIVHNQQELITYQQQQLQELGVQVSVFQNQQRIQQQQLEDSRIRISQLEYQHFVQQQLQVINQGFPSSEVEMEQSMSQQNHPCRPHGSAFW